MSISRRFGVSLLGMVIANAFTFLMFPYVANLYGASQVGAYGEIIASANLLVVVATMRLENSLPQTQDIGEAVGVSQFVLIFSIVFCSFVYCFFNKSLYLIFLVVLQSQYLIYSALMVKVDKIKILSSVRVFRSISVVVLQLALFYAFPEDGLIASFVFCCFLATLLLVCFVRFYGKDIDFSFSIKRIYKCIDKRLGFIIFGMPNAFLLILISSLPAIALPHYYSLSLVGLIVFVDRVIGTPFNLANQALRELLLKFGTDSKHVLKYIIITFVGLLVAFCLKEVIIELFSMLLSLMNPEWHDASRIVFPVLVFYSSLLIMLPATTGLIRCDKQWIALLYSCLLVSIVLLVFARLLSENEDFYNVIEYYYTGIAIFNVLYAWSATYWLSKNSLQESHAEN